MTNFDLLIVDDDPAFRKIHEALVSRSEFHQAPVLLENGQTTIEYLESNPSGNKLLLLDIFMPVVDGWAVLDYIEELKKPESIKVILITSSVNKSDKVKAMDYVSVIEYIEKPLVEDYLRMLKNQFLF
ncbi:response regulator [Algoriphagus marincola]|uniref:Response regulator n=1 Tax=Algoriphagus marincola TaxID=264027 RepID=A0ABS7N0H7_9BACT|nr:response regulator [Algoriphagus marincola]MBY5949491.1 response regulator [Algoriphagus marincola]